MPVERLQDREGPCHCSQAFGSFDDFKAAWATAAAGVFGSGWAWLAVAKDGSVKIVTSPNQVSVPMAPMTW